MMKGLIVGLGNPGTKYEKTRHNVGFMAADEIAANFQFPAFNYKSIFNSQVSEGEIDGQKTVLAKPRSFMNNSGIAVKSLTKCCLLGANNLMVIHDDIDLPVGKLKIQKGRGAAGHKGAQSIINELGTKDFWRARIGVCPSKGKPKNVEKFVLQNFNKNEEKIIKALIARIAEEIKNLPKIC